MSMKKFITPILIAIIIVMGGYIIFEKYQTSKNDVQNNNQEVSQIATDTEKQSGDLFTKKKVCFDQLDKIQQIIKESNGNLEGEVLEEIFYSPTLNTCLYTSSFSTNIDGENYILSYDIYDALTLKALYSFYLSDYEDDYAKNGISYLRAVNKVRNDILKRKVEELKN